MTGFLKLFITGAAAFAFVFALGIPAYAQNIDGAAVIDAETTLDDAVSITVGGSADTSVGNVVDGDVDSTSNVQTNEDFDVYAATTLESNQEITAVDATESSVSVGFVESAQLFGFIPVSLKSRVVVHADGSVKVIRPWYSVFAVKNDAYQSTELTAAVAALPNDALGEDGGFTARGKAFVTERIVSSLGGNTDVAGSAAGGTMLEGTVVPPGTDVSAQ